MWQRRVGGEVVRSAMRRAAPPLPVMFRGGGGGGREREKQNALGATRSQSTWVIRVGLVVGLLCSPGGPAPLKPPELRREVHGYMNGTAAGRLQREPGTNGAQLKGFD